jgi:hypothetical protein
MIVMDVQTGTVVETEIQAKIKTSQGTEKIGIGVRIGDALDHNIIRRRTGSKAQTISRTAHSIRKKSRNRSKQIFLGGIGLMSIAAYL